MSDPVRWGGQMPAPRGQQQQAPAAGDGGNLADILERVLDKGIVIAGDIQINLLDIELLTIKLRLVVASVDRAKEMGIDWWERDPTLSSGHQDLLDENRRLRERLEAWEDGRPDALPAGDDQQGEDGVDGDPADDSDDDSDSDEGGVDDAEGEADGDEADEDEADEDEADDEADDEEEPAEAPRPARRARKRSASAARRPRS